MSDDQNSEPMDAYEALEILSEERKLEVASAIGKVTLAWNKLQESLAFLFASILRHREEAALAVWHSQKSDLAQRDMIRAATLANANELRSDVMGEIKWLLDRADSLSSCRNDTIHTHFSLRIEENKIVYLLMTGLARSTQRNFKAKTHSRNLTDIAFGPTVCPNMP